MKLKTRTVYVYYDFPIIFSATDEEGDIFICLFADETDSYFKYFCREVSFSLLKDLECNKRDIRSIFESPGKLYTLCLNAQSEEPVEAVETSEDITSLLPEKGFFIGIHESKTPQITVLTIPAHLIGVNFNGVLPDYCAESPEYQYQAGTEAVFSGDFQWLTEAA
jgi:hypothetical protein